MNGLIRISLLLAALFLGNAFARSDSYNAGADLRNVDLSKGKLGCQVRMSTRAVSWPDVRTVLSCSVILLQPHFLDEYLDKLEKETGTLKSYLSANNKDLAETQDEINAKKREIETLNDKIAVSKDEQADIRNAKLINTYTKTIAIYETNLKHFQAETTKASDELSSIDQKVEWVNATKDFLEALKSKQATAKVSKLLANLDTLGNDELTGWFGRVVDHMSGSDDTVTQDQAVQDEEIKEIIAKARKGAKQSLAK